jgi:hypothetical protein
VDLIYQDALKMRPQLAVTAPLGLPGDLRAIVQKVGKEALPAAEIL